MQDVQTKYQLDKKERTGYNIQAKAAKHQLETIKQRNRGLEATGCLKDIALVLYDSKASNKRHPCIKSGVHHLCK